MFLQKCTKKRLKSRRNLRRKRRLKVQVPFRAGTAAAPVSPPHISSPGLSLPFFLPFLLLLLLLPHLLLILLLPLFLFTFLLKRYTSLLMHPYGGRSIS